MYIHRKFPLREPDKGTGDGSGAAGTPAASSSGEGQGQAGEAGAEPPRQQPQWRGTADGAPIASNEPPGGSQSASTGGEADRSASGGQQGEGQQPQVMGRGGPMSEEAIADRVARDRKKWLRETFGTEDEAEAKKRMQQLEAEAEQRRKDQADLDRYRQAEEKRKREQMSREERLQADLQKEREKRAQLETQLREKEENEVVSQQDQVIRDEAVRHVDDRYVKYARRDLAEHFRQLPEKDQKSFGPTQLKKFMREWAKDNPAMARQADAGKGNGQAQQGEGQPAQPAKPKPQPRRAPMATSRANPSRGAPPEAGKGGPDIVAGKTVKPGLPNSMSKAELNQHYREQFGRSKPW